MTSPSRTDELFDQVDTNQDGKIDRNELRNWATSGEERISSSCESLTGRFNVGESSTTRYDQYTTYGSTTGLHNYSNETAIQTSSAEETNRYLATSAHDIFRDSNPKIIRRPASGGPLTQEQRVSVRYLRPPTPPPPEPLIIREVRPPQPSPPPPLVIREQPPKSATPPPLILRERPPNPPPHIPGEIKTRELSPIPAPKRSVVIERFPATPAKPRDIIIERWLPYGPRPERRTIVEPAPPAQRYPEATHTIILHENVDARVSRKFENLGVSREDPNMYSSRYGGSLLDSMTLVTEARNAGVTEDLSPPVGSSLVTNHTRDYTSGCERSNYITNYERSNCTAGYERSNCTAGYGYSSNCAGYDGLQLGTRRDTYLGNTRYLSSSTNRVNDIGSGYYGSNLSARFQVNGAGVSASIRLGDGETKEIEYKRYI